MQSNSRICASSSTTSMCSLISSLTKQAANQVRQKSAFGWSDHENNFSSKCLHLIAPAINAYGTIFPHKKRLIGPWRTRLRSDSPLPFFSSILSLKSPLKSSHRLNSNLDHRDSLFGNNSF